VTVVVGVDAGASHTDAVVTDETLATVGRASGPPGSVGVAGLRAATTAITQAIQTAIDRAGNPPVGTVVVGAAGAGREEERAALERGLVSVLGPAVRIRVTTDALIALEDAFEGESGILVAAGTGSIAVARDRSGAVHRAGGYGYQFGDDAGGYALVRHALGAVARAADGRGSPTALEDRFLRAAGGRWFDDLVRWVQRGGYREVASLAPIVCELALARDGAAQAAVDHVCRELASHVVALARHFDEHRPLPLAFSGSLLSAGSPVRQGLAKRVRDAFPHVSPLDRPVDPARGAARMARHG
jgi:N-acetylglucosamine kinase-like BadF-type ATPase